MSAEMDLYSTTIHTNKVDSGIAYIVTKSCYNQGSEYLCTEVYHVVNNGEDYDLLDCTDHANDISEDELIQYHDTIVQEWSN